MWIVGINGLIGSGKTTVANVFAEHYGFTTVNFADALKREVATRLKRTLTEYVNLAYPSAHSNKGGVEEKIRELIYDRKDRVTRALLQEYGTEIRRADITDYWINALYESLVSKDGYETGKFVIADVRFMNEYQSIMADPVLEYSAVLKVVRPGLPYNDHVSEHLAVDPNIPWTAVIHNDGSLEDLKQKVHLVWDTIKPASEPR